MISFKILMGILEDISRQGQCDLVDALSTYNKCTKRFHFKQKSKFEATHAHSVRRL